MEVDLLKMQVDVVWSVVDIEQSIADMVAAVVTNLQAGMNDTRAEGSPLSTLRQGVCHYSNRG